MNGMQLRRNTVMQVRLLLPANISSPDQNSECSLHFIGLAHTDMRWLVERARYRTVVKLLQGNVRSEMMTKNPLHWHKVVVVSQLL